VQKWSFQPIALPQLHYTLQVTLEKTFPANHLTGAKNGFSINRLAGLETKSNCQKLQQKNQ